MRVFTIKASRKLIFGIAMAAVAIFVGIMALIGTSVSRTASSHVENIQVSEESQRIAFLEQFGWTVEREPEEIREIVIPSEFNDVYQNYNKIQTEQGFDLTKYQGCTVKKWTYVVTNYPGYENSRCILASLLIYEDQVVGGDICSTELDGFMHGFKKNQ